MITKEKLPDVFNALHTIIIKMTSVAATSNNHELAELLKTIEYILKEITAEEDETATVRQLLKRSATLNPYCLRALEAFDNEKPPF